MRKIVPLALSVLEKRGFIRIDYDIPLAGFGPMRAMKSAFEGGSLALTAKGQDVIERLAVQGVN